MDWLEPERRARKIDGRGADRNGDDAHPRKGSASPRLDETEFKKRFRSQFADEAYDKLDLQLDRIAEAAWNAYANESKSPHTRKAGPGYADPDYELAVDWIAAKEAIDAAMVRHDDAAGPLRILLINGSSRSKHTCPSELSKSWRLTQIAREALEERGITVEFLDLEPSGVRIRTPY